jgi:hypothetical protein
MALRPTSGLGRLEFKGGGLLWRMPGRNDAPVVIERTYVGPYGRLYLRWTEGVLEYDVTRVQYTIGPDLYDGSIFVATTTGKGGAYGTTLFGVGSSGDPLHISGSVPVVAPQWLYIYLRLIQFSTVINNSDTYLFIAE